MCVRTPLRNCLTVKCSGGDGGGRRRRAPMENRVSSPSSSRSPLTQSAPRVRTFLAPQVARGQVDFACRTFLDFSSDVQTRESREPRPAAGARSRTRSHDSQRRRRPPGAAAAAAACCCRHCRRRRHRRCHCRRRHRGCVSRRKVRSWTTARMCARALSLSPSASSALFASAERRLTVRLRMLLLLLQRRRRRRRRRWRRRLRQQQQR